MPFTPNYKFSIPTPADPAQFNNWGTMENTGRSLADTALGGVLALAVTGGTTVLTANDGAPDQSRNAHFNFSGVLASNQTVLWPQDCGRMFSVTNGTTGAFSLILGANNGSGAAAGLTVTVPQGATWICYSDGTNIKIRQSAIQPTRTVLASGSGTYTTPPGCVQLRIFMVGPGGGGGAYNSGGDGSDGTDTAFNSIVAKTGRGGKQGTNSPTFGDGGVGGASGTGTASLRRPGQSGTSGIYSVALGLQMGSGSPGGNSLLGAGSTTVSSPAAANSGGGGAGAPSFDPSTGGGGGGGAGEYVEIIINNPAASYAYAVGAGGSGAPGASAGGSGAIIVDEIY